VKKSAYIFCLVVILFAMQNVVFSSLHEQDDDFSASWGNSSLNNKRRVRLIHEIKKFIKKRDFKSAAVFLKLLKRISPPDDAKVIYFSRIIEEGLAWQQDRAACYSSDFVLSYRQMINYQLNHCNIPEARNIYSRFQHKCQRFIPSTLDKIYRQIKKKDHSCRIKQKEYYRIAQRKEKLIEGLIKQKNLAAAEKALAESRAYLSSETRQNLHTQLLEAYKKEERKEIEKEFESLEEEVQEGDYHKAEAGLPQLLKRVRYNNTYAQRRYQEILQAIKARKTKEKAERKEKAVEKALYKTGMLMKIRQLFRAGKVEEAKTLINQLKMSFPADEQVRALESYISRQEEEFNLLLGEIKKLLTSGYYLESLKIINSLKRDYPVLSQAHKNELESLQHEIYAWQQRQKMILEEQLETYVKKGDYKNANDILEEIKQKCPNDAQIQMLADQIKKMLLKERESEKKLQLIRRLQNALSEETATSSQVKVLIKDVED